MSAEAPAASTETEPLPLRRPDGRSLLGARALSAARAIAEAVFAAADGAPPRDRLDWLVSELEDFTARAGWRARFVLRLMIGVVSILAPLCIGRLTPARRLALPDRIRALATLERRFGEPLLALKAVLCIIYYEHPDAAREAGFDAACFVPSTGRASIVSGERVRRLRGVEAPK